MNTTELKMTEQVAELDKAMFKHREAMGNLNVSYGGYGGGIDSWGLNRASEQLTKNIEILEFWENLLNEAKAATTELQAAMHAMPELIEYKRAEYEQN
jgi:hypothetical protein